MMKKLLMLIVLLAAVEMAVAQEGKKQWVCYGPVEVMPSFPGGVTALKKYLKENIRYPEECREDSIQGRVVVGFLISKRGKIKHAHVKRSLHPLLDKEALRVVKSMPKWSP